jgi:hypothetical protein
MQAATIADDRIIADNIYLRRLFLRVCYSTVELMNCRGKFKSRQHSSKEKSASKVNITSEIKLNKSIRIYMDTLCGTIPLPYLISRPAAPRYSVFQWPTQTHNYPVIHFPSALSIL